MTCMPTIMVRSISLSILVLIIFKDCEAKKITESNCEVCMKFVNSLVHSIPESDRASAAKVEEAFVTKCKTAKGKDNKFCYLIGGLEISSTRTIGLLVQPITSFFPPEKICEKLSNNNPEVCELRYDKVIDLKTFNLNSARIRDLKKIIEGWGLECRGCVEKSDFIHLIKENMHIHDAEAAAFLKQKEEL